MKLIIADDSSIIRERIRVKIKDLAQFELVGEATNGKLALEMIRQLDPDVIILDLHMPEMGGIEVLKRIKEGRFKAKVCILTNYTYPQYKSRCMSLGAEYFLSKSEDFEKLDSVISAIINESQNSSEYSH